MDASSGPGVISLVQPRVVTVALITATAVVSVGASLLFENWRQGRAAATTAAATDRTGGGLHRSNAVRRHRRGSQGDAAPSVREQLLQQHLAMSDDDVLAADQDTILGNMLAAARRSDTADLLDRDGLDGQDNAQADARSGGDPNGGMDAEPGADDAFESRLDDMRHPAARRAGQNIVSLLFRVSEDNARRSASVHRGCACNACGIVPIRGIRYRCANCADFDLCEICESQSLHIKTHIFYKVRVPAPPFGPRQMQPVWYPGDPDSRVRNLSRALIARLSCETGFERQELEAFWEQWTYMANTEWRDDPDELGLAMDRKTFERCLVPSGGYRHAGPNLIHDRMFAFYDTNHDGLISFSEFLHGLSYRKRKDKLRKIFDGYDTDRDGLVSRRDFLRFFRAYYVLYKQMHKDILEGLDDQIMSSVEAHQLIAGRQPLSSLFGREGRVPGADLDRMMPGKAVQNESGEVVVLTDPASGVVADDAHDTASREDILARMFARPDARLRRTGVGVFAEPFIIPGTDDADEDADDNADEHYDDENALTTYLDALLNVPTSLDDLPALLIGQTDPSRLPNDDIFVATVDNEYDSAPEPPSTSIGERDDAPAPAPTPAPDAADEADADASASGISALDSDLLEQLYTQDGSARVRFNKDKMPTLGQLRAHQVAFMRAHKLRTAKTAARRKLHNRWMRRHFYLDEEEGATQPAGWKPDADVLAPPNAVAAAKVKFAESGGGDGAADEDENQPSPSSSARTVLPDPWDSGTGKHGDLPEAEKDAGYEILYQVMQQAFNELLDILFLAKEDLAIAAARCKAERDKYRPLFEHVDAEAAGTEAADDGAAGRGNKSSVPRKGAARHRTNDADDVVLEDLLAHTGFYVVSEDATDENNDNTSGDGGNTTNDSADDDAAAGDVARTESTRDRFATVVEIPDAPPLAAEEAFEDERDPTMPQFRPNTDAEYRARLEASRARIRAAALPPTAEPHKDDNSAAAINHKGKEKEGDTTRALGNESASASAPTKTPAQPSPSKLAEWKRLDLAEQEANTRGGWGRLSYAEFEAIFKEEEKKSNRLDYLGSWIDFCIP